MITFASFPAAPHVGGYSQPHHPYNVSDAAEMDLDGDELDDDGSNLTCPGESLTSSQAFMR
jgi:exosome complex component RRP4